MLGIELADVYAALTYYYDHQQAIDDELAIFEGEYVAEMMQHRSAVQEKLARLGLSLEDANTYLEQADVAALAAIRSHQSASTFTCTVRSRGPSSSAR